MRNSLNIEILPYSEKYAAAHRIFAEKIWPQKSRRYCEEFIRWKFRAKPQGNVQGLLLAIQEEKVVGQVGLIPASLKSHGQQRTCQWVCDFMVAPELRGRGLGPRLLRRAVEIKNITLGLNPTASSLAVHTRVGFANYKGPKLMMLPLRLNEMLRWKMKKGLWPLVPIAAAMGKPLLHWRTRHLSCDKESTDSFKICSWEDILLLIQEKQATYKAPYILHDREFISWRCNPPQTLRRGTIAIRNSSKSYALIEITPLYLYICDWFAENENSRKALFQKVYRLAREEDSEIIQILAHGQEIDGLAQLGFLEVRRRTVILFYPGKFQSEYQNLQVTLMDSDGGDM